MYAKVYSAQTDVSNPVLIKIETSIEEGMPQLSVVGLPDKAVEEAKDRVSSALENATFTKSEDFKTLKSKFGKVTISLAPADIKKTGSLFDLPIALAYLVATSELAEIGEKDLFLGELDLNGSLAPVKGALSASILAKEKGFKRLFLPKENAKEAGLVKGVEIYGMESISDVVEFLRGNKEAAQKQPETDIANLYVKSQPKLLLDDIKGQQIAKRALVISIAGGHNLAFFGPPGTGKSMLAKVYRELLPKLSYEEVLEVTKIHSVSGALEDGQIITKPPLRAPHHSSSYVSIVGGGAKITPGEITLAHKGVLFMDEFPEFDKRVINALREPLEEKKITVSRATGTKEFPADFVLLVALNPCPCGYMGTSKCSCSFSQIQKYQNKISGPVADRIDMWTEVAEVDYNKLLNKEKREAKEHKKAMELIQKAREAQRKRFKANKLNAHMSAPAINTFVVMQGDAKEILNMSASKMNLSGRAYHKVIKVAQTIADMEGEETIKKEAILEALAFREKGIK